MSSRSPTWSRDALGPHEGNTWAVEDNYEAEEEQTIHASATPAGWARQNWAIPGVVTQTHWGAEPFDWRPALWAMRCCPACDLEPSQAAVSHCGWPCSCTHTVLSLPAAANWL